MYCRHVTKVGEKAKDILEQIKTGYLGTVVSILLEIGRKPSCLVFIHKLKISLSLFAT